MKKRTYKTLLFFLLCYQFMIAQTPPTAQNEYDTAEINTPLVVGAPGVLKNDTDPDGDILTITYFFVNGIQFTAGQTASFAQGSITINTDGSYTFIPTTDYVGNVPTINYVVSDGVLTSSANLLLTVEYITNLLKIRSYSTCNQGFTVNGEYKTIYTIGLKNYSTARDFHPANMVKNIDLTDDLQATFGNACVTNVNITSMYTYSDDVLLDKIYPEEFSYDAINPDFLTVKSNSVFSADAIKNLTLYPQQNLIIQFCVTVNPFCNGRPNPTPSGSGINFDNVINVTSSIGNDTDNLLITDFHTSEAIVAAGLYIPEIQPVVNPDGTYDYSNTVVITNEGTATAKNVNYNMGLGYFLNNGIVFKKLTVSQVSGPPVSLNSSYNGDTETFLLNANNSLKPGETIILKIYTLIASISSINYSYFSTSGRSLTQGILDGFDETIAANKRAYSYVNWSDNLGNHLDRYYPVSSATKTASSASQCSCSTSRMKFTFTSSSSNKNTISAINEAPNGILEHQEITFQLTITNTSEVSQLDNLQLQDNLNSLCGGNIIAFSKPFIQNSTATIDPVLNTAYDGISDFNLFNGSSGLLNANEAVTIQFSVVFNEDCINKNTTIFTATNPLKNVIKSFGSANINASTDTDNDGITNLNDLDDDNDTIPDTDEYNGLNPLADDDADFIPNYRDLDFGTDKNNDGIVDIFDFDNDGVPNHFDLDSDNDGVLDIVEAGNSIVDTNNNGQTNTSVGANGLDNSVETSDSFTAKITYVNPNTDGNGNLNFLDIDADGDGIVDNIEAQLTSNYTAPNNVVGTTGIDTAYPNGITPTDTDNDTFFDYVDTNADNDIRDDIIEGWDTNSDGTAETIASNIDLDKDGLDDAFDTNDHLVNPSNNQIPTDFPNVDNVDNPERDWREIIAIFVIIDNFSVTEGGDLVFNITLVTKNNNSILIQSASPININFSTVNGTDTATTYQIATAPFDYTGVTTTLTIPPFTDKSKFTIPSLEDIIYEKDELFTLNGSITSNNTINSQIKAIGTIIDNDSPPSISMNNSIENEGVDLVHTITLSNPSSTPINIDIHTNDVLAISPDDYTAITKNLTIEGTIDPNNANTQTSFHIITKKDNVNELDLETLAVIGTVTTTNVGAQDLIKTGTIVDIDPYPIIFVSDTTTVEGNLLEFKMTLLNSSFKPMQNYLPINLRVETSDDTANSITDYQSLSTTKIIPAYTSSIKQSIITIDDRLNEDTETMRLIATIIDTNIANVSSATGIGFIKDNDYPNLFSPNDDGKSDLFKISGIEDFPNFKLKIVDRWGSDVYNYNNNGRKNPIWWNGMYNGKPVPEGVYYYTLDYNDGSTKPRTNFIQLVR